LLGLSFPRRGASKNFGWSVFGDALRLVEGYNGVGLEMAYIMELGVKYGAV
jgi:hypothetical protein